MAFFATVTQDAENDEKIKYLKEAEEAALQKKEIINTETGFTESKSNFILANSDGFIMVINLHLFQHHVLLLPKMQMTKWKEIMNLQALVIYKICLDQVKLDY